MKITPKTEAEIEAEAAKRGAWAPGVYDAEIMTAIEGVSAKGNDMITLTLTVYHPDDGAQRQMKDWLVDAMAFKVRHCCEAAGLLADYEAGDLDAWKLEGKPVKAKLGTETYRTDDGRSGTRNKVVDYVPDRTNAPPRTPARAPATVGAKGEDFDSDIPF